MSNRADEPMDCSEAERLILGGFDSPRVREHLEGCPACAALAVDGGTLAGRLADHRSPQQPPPADLLAAIEGDLAREGRGARRLRSLATPARVAVALAGGLVVVGIGLLKLRPDAGTYPLLRLVLQASAVALTGLVAGWLWLRPLQRPALPRWVPALVALAAVILPWGLSALPPAHLDHPASLAGVAGDLLPRAASCFLFGSLLGAPLALWLALLGRGARGQLRLAALPAAAGGLGGLLGLDLHCPLTSPVHLLAGHAPIVLILVLAGAGVSVLARRAATRR